jgi:D-lactate dehydrogenase (cytochrome)
VQKQVQKQVAEQLKAIVGPTGYREAAADLEPYLTEWRGLYTGTTPLMLLPDSVAQVSEILRICNETSTAVVPQGGNTGLAGGAIAGADGSADQILLSTARLKRVREIDVDNYTITVEAGCILADVQRAAAEAGRFFPLSLAAEGSCQIGGNISTNAGGTNVLRFGNMRDLVLGLEVVLPNGDIFPNLRAVRKDNTGYDLKQLFIGAEGTLGVITAATLKLFPEACSTATAWLAVDSPERAVQLYSAARESLGDELIAFELIPRLAIDMVLEHIPGSRDPLSGGAQDWYVLLELGSARGQSDVDEQLTTFLGNGLEQGWLQDGIVASSQGQREELWRIRHAISEAQKLAGASVKHDVSVPVSRMPEFLQRADRLVKDKVPGIRMVAFGHLGDGNLHYNLSQPVDMSADEFLNLWEPLNEIVHGLAAELNGSFSAEHGIGFLKVGELERLESPVKLELMRTIKRAIDPAGIMNPGKVLRR